MENSKLPDKPDPVKAIVERFLSLEADISDLRRRLRQKLDALAALRAEAEQA